MKKPIVSSILTSYNCQPGGGPIRIASNQKNRMGLRVSILGVPEQTEFSGGLTGTVNLVTGAISITQNLSARSDVQKGWIHLSKDDAGNNVNGFPITLLGNSMIEWCRCEVGNFLDNEFWFAPGLIGIIPFIFIGVLDTLLLGYEED